MLRAQQLAKRHRNSEWFPFSRATPGNEFMPLRPNPKPTFTGEVQTSRSAKQEERTFATTDVQCFGFKQLESKAKSGRGREFALGQIMHNTKAEAGEAPDVTCGREADRKYDRFMLPRGRPAQDAQRMYDQSRWQNRRKQMITATE